MSHKSLVRLIACLVILAGAGIARGEAPDPEIRLERGRFEPAQLVIPANTPFKVRVTNADTVAIEFESFELHRERIVQPGETITVYFPPLSSGSYQFFDDFHRDTPPGAIVAQ
jgi:heme/copper-type cytochrome/quinol oxidase subunit 2